jgi:protease-4
VLQYDEFEAEFERHFGQRAVFIQPESLEARTPGRWGAPPKVAVLYAVGTITDGESVSNPFTGSLSTGADTFLKATRALREDDAVKAVVLRIDSPGGSVTASDAMWRELTLLAKEKPLVVSMGDVAASGGYYIAVPGAEIFAEANTITGSIGVFTGKADLSGLLSWIGVHTETFIRGARADLLTLNRSWTDDEVTALRASMEALYALFLDRVSASRPRLPRDALEQVAQGRVWTGAAARAHGLIDREAGLFEAIHRATELARLDRDDIALQIAPTGGGLGALPRSPVLSRLVEAMGQAPVTALATHLPAPLRQLLDLPLAHFQAGEPLAMLPFVFSP